MITSSVSSNGIPPDLEFSLDEISAELAKLGVRETSPTRLAAIKADLDKMIARDLDSLSLDGRGDCTLGSSSLTTTSSLSLTYGSDPLIFILLFTFFMEANSILRKRWIDSIHNNDNINRRILDSYIADEDNPVMLEKTHSNRVPLRLSPPESTDLDRNLPRSRSAPSRRLFPSNQRRGMNRSDPVSLWRMYNRQWERQARTNAISERALRWSVKAAMSVREVPLLNSSRRSLLNGPFSSVNKFTVLIVLKWFD
ncbi:unnamed protein product [Hymenolepis diminuta]|uniref:HYLS1_C domain-containing protein n=1 Tax=Hymenolepis diminuta TaxID=6216 RepID=A0A0R3S8N8_HYMDI|nr:unnamed protein product [Hymenolepis diminuta]